MPAKVANTHAITSSGQALIKEIRIYSALLERPPGASDSFSMPLGKLQHVKVSHQSVADSGGIVPAHPYHGSYAVAW
jgi:hypothetical protein